MCILIAKLCQSVQGIKAIVGKSLVRYCLVMRDLFQIQSVLVLCLYQQIPLIAIS